MKRIMLIKRKTNPLHPRLISCPNEVRAKF
jgi:hypothetical protein